MEIKNFAINVKTQKQYDLLVELLHDNDYMFRDCERLNWEFFKEKTCVVFNRDKIINYDPVDYFLECEPEYAIISFDYFMANTSLKYRPQKMTISEIEKKLGYEIIIAGE